MKYLSVFCLLALFQLSVTASEGPNYPCYFVEQKPIVDGILNDACWKNLPKAKGFFSLTDGYVLWRQTEFQAGWNNSPIYIGIKAYEPYVDRLKPKQSDGDYLCSDDSIELFFVTGSGPEYFQLVANSIGKRWNKKYPSRTEPVWGWRAKGSQGQGCWYLEIEIPFNVFKKKTVKNEKWRINISRNAIIGTRAERYSSWPLLKKGFHDRKNFGIFTFIKKIPSKKEILLYNKNLGNYAETLVKKTALKYQQYIPLLKYAKHLVSGTEIKKLNNIKRRWELLSQVSSGKWTIQQMSEALKAMRGLEAQTEELKYIILLEKLIKEGQ